MIGNRSFPLSRMLLPVIALAVISALPSRAGAADIRGPVAPLDPAGVDTLGTPWFAETIDSEGDVGSRLSMVRHPETGKLYITYYDKTNGHLKLAKQVDDGGNCGPGNRWHCEIVDSTGDVGLYSSVAIDPMLGYPHIAYYDATNKALKYASYFCFMDCYWTIHTIETGIPMPPFYSGLYPSLKIGSDGEPQIAYHRSGLMYGALKYARYVGEGGNCGLGAWQCDVIDEQSSGRGTGLYPSLDLSQAVTPLNVPYIAYYDGVNGDLRLAWYRGDGGGACGPDNDWGCTTIDAGDLNADVGRYPAMRAFRGHPSEDRSAIAYYDATNRRVKYAHPKGGGNCGGGAWQCDTIPNYALSSESEARIALDLAVDSSYDPVIVYGYRLGPMYPLFIARYVGSGGNCGPPLSGGSWQCDVAVSDPGSEHDLSQYASLSINSADLMTLAYYDTTAGDLMWAQQRLQISLPLVTRGG